MFQHTRLVFQLRQTEMDRVQLNVLRAINLSELLFIKGKLNQLKNSFKRFDANTIKGNLVYWVDLPQPDQVLD